MNRDVLSVLVRAGMDEGYAPLISKDSVMRLWRLTRSYQLEIPLTCGSAWTAELSDVPQYTHAAPTSTSTFVSLDNDLTSALLKDSAKASRVFRNWLLTPTGSQTRC